MLEIRSLQYPLRLRGRVGGHEWSMVGIGSHWVFYVEDAWMDTDDHLWALTAKMPFADQMPSDLAIRISHACAKEFERRLSTTDNPPQ